MLVHAADIHGQVAHAAAGVSSSFISLTHSSCGWPVCARVCACAGDGSQSGLNLTNMWIKIVTQWVCIGLYVWTLVAPLVCSERSFA